jgi:hypothetical protein
MTCLSPSEKQTSGAWEQPATGEAGGRARRRQHRGPVPTVAIVTSWPRCRRQHVQHQPRRRFRFGLGVGRVPTRPKLEPPPPPRARVTPTPHGPRHGPRPPRPAGPELPRVARLGGQHGSSTARPLVDGVLHQLQLHDEKKNEASCARVGMHTDCLPHSTITCLIPIHISRLVVSDTYPSSFHFYAYINLYT